MKHYIVEAAQLLQRLTFTRRNSQRIGNYPMDHLELAIAGHNYLRISSMLPEFASADKSLLLLQIFKLSSFPSVVSNRRKQKTHFVSR
jgi:hypothetical protein